MELDTFDKTIFDMLKSMAEKNSKCTRRQTAAAIVSDDGGIVSMGYNGPPRQMRHCNDNGCLRSMIPGIISGDMLHLCSAVHAEENAIINAGRQSKSCIGHTIFTLHSPCYHCTKLIIQAGISRIIADEEYTDPFGHSMILQAKSATGIQYQVLNKEVNPEFNSIIIISAEGDKRRQFSIDINNWTNKSIIENTLDKDQDGIKDMYFRALSHIEQKFVPIMAESFVRMASHISYFARNDEQIEDLLHLRRIFDPLIRPLYIFVRSVNCNVSYEIDAQVILQNEDIRYYDFIIGECKNVNEIYLLREHLEKRVRNL